MELEEEVVQDKIDLATLHFKSKNYAQSLALYNEVETKLASLTPSEIIRIRKFHRLSPKPLVGLLVHPKLPGVLDSRAAAFEKLNKVDLALKDAERLRKIDPVNCKGYLRTGKLLLKQDAVVDAYKCYQEGLYFIGKAREKYNLEVPEKLLGQLTEQRKKINEYLKAQNINRHQEPKEKETISKKSSLSTSLLKKEATKLRSFSSNGLQRRLDEMLPLKRSKSVSSIQVTKKPKNDLDFMLRLPREVIEFIIALVPTRSLLKCHIVCRDWYQTLTAMPNLYKDIFTLKHRVSSYEYFQGLRLLKKVLMFLYLRSVHSVKLWSTLNEINFNKILESIITDKHLRLKNLEIINLLLCYELLFKVIDKCKWDVVALASIKHLRLGFNSSVPEIHSYFKLFPNLRSFEVVIIDQKLRGSNRYSLPLDTAKTEEFIAGAKKIETMEDLKSLVLVNHTGLTREFQNAKSSSRTYTATPRFLEVRMSNLRKLTVVNFDFTNLEANFGRFLSCTPHLLELYLENNAELDLKQFITILRLYEPAFALEELTLREKPRNLPYNMVEVDAEGLKCLFCLTHLDIYGSSLSCRGLLKLLSVANRSFLLKTLNLGNSNFVHFRKDSFVTNHEVLQFSQLLELVPGIRTLFLNEMDLDNLSMKLLHQDLVKLSGYAECPLKKIDLSFCHQIDGIGLMNLVNASYSQLGQNSSLQFDELVLDGLSLNRETLALLKNRNLVTKLMNDPNKAKWRQYGVNSLVQEVRSA